LAILAWFVSQSVKQALHRFAVARNRRAAS
jgi:hypothetical protein